MLGSYRFSVIAATSFLEYPPDRILNGAGLEINYSTSPLTLAAS